MSILEIGGYPDFTRLYERAGFEVCPMESMRKATRSLKSLDISVVVAEFNFQSDFRDRSSQVETLMASLAQKKQVQVIIFFDKDQQHQFDKINQQFEFAASFSYPIDEDLLYRTVERLAGQQD